MVLWYLNPVGAGPCGAQEAAAAASLDQGVIAAGNDLSLRGAHTHAGA